MRNIIKIIPRDFLFFLIAVACIGFAQSMVDSTFNNYLSDHFHITDLQRSFLEVPRELPGLLVIFVSALLFFLCNRTLAALSQLLAGIGVFLIGCFSFNYSVMLVWLFVYSLGQHLFLPLTSDIGMELAKEGQTGRRLGQLQGASNFAGIAGSFFVFLGFKYLDFSFMLTFIISAVCFCLGAIMIYSMKKNTPVPFKSKFVFRKEYRLYYILTILYGMRKQIFITFAPWVLITVFSQKTQSIATLLTIGGVIGIAFKPLLGRAIDRYGEKIILAGEAVFLVLICGGYAFAQKLLPMNIALIIVSACYVIDQLLMSVGMARATYLKKIAVDPQDVTSTLTAGLSVDHIFSISIALLGGLIWKTMGYQYIFLLGGMIAMVNFCFAVKIVGAGLPAR
jgi:predicted MFS family arabinose efflux permease